MARKYIKRKMMHTWEVKKDARFGKWLVTGVPYLCNRWGKNKLVCECTCDCGTIRIVKCASLACSESISCGCRLAYVSRTHGKRYDRVYAAWRSMLNRCYINNEIYLNYRNKGIKVCKRWQKFEYFFADMGDPPDGMSLDRIDNNGHYNRKNCRWATRKTQQRNRRSVKIITFNGITQSLPDWGDTLGISSHILLRRINYGGWSIEKTLTTPLQHQHYKR